MSSHDEMIQHIKERETSLKKLDSVHDLTRGDRQYLARKGITGFQWDSMTPREQHEWKEEMKNPSYDRNDKDYKTQNMQFKYL